MGKKNPLKGTKLEGKYYDRLTRSYKNIADRGKEEIPKLPLPKEAKEAVEPPKEPKEDKEEKETKEEK